MNSNQPYTPYSSTDTINNMIPVTINGNIVEVLGQEYILPNPVLFKLAVNLPNTVVYAMAVSQGIIQQALQITVVLNSSEEATAVVSIINYYYLTGTQTFPATQVTVTNGNMTAQLDAALMDTATYTGSSFTLNGNVLQGQTILTGTTITSETGPNAPSASGAP